MNHEHFAFRSAEQILDTFCLAEDRLQGFKRTYRKLKLVLAATALADFGSTDEAALACAWEELQIALTGRGDDTLVGPCIQFWRYTTKPERKQLRQVFENAFKRAELDTGPEVSRLYTTKWRRAPFLVLNDLDAAMQKVPLVPYSGPKLKDFAEDSGYHLAALAHWQEQEEAADRIVNHHANQSKGRKPKLTVVEP